MQSSSYWAHGYITIFSFEREAENRSFCRQPAVSALKNKPFLDILGWTAGHSMGARRKKKQCETFDWIWTVLQKKRGRLVSRDLLRTEVRIVHTTWPNLVWKLLFQLRSQISLNSSASKYLVFVTSHSDLPVSPSLLLFTSLLHLVHQHCKIQYWGVSNTF